MRIRRFVLAAALGIASATGAVWALASPPREGFAADPAVHLSDKRWTFDLAYVSGKGSITRAQARTLSKPAGTARAMGRFALELWVGKELLDRIRFDVPLLGDDPQDKDPKRPFKRPSFGNVTTRVKVEMADHARATVLAFVDRSTGSTQRFFWPPDEKGNLTPFSAQAATSGDAGADATFDALGDATSLTLDGAAPDAAVGDAATSDGGAADGSASDAAVDAPRDAAGR